MVLLTPRKTFSSSASSYLNLSDEFESADFSRIDGGPLSERDLQQPKVSLMLGDALPRLLLEFRREREQLFAEQAQEKQIQYTVVDQLTQRLLEKHKAAASLKRKMALLSYKPALPLSLKNHSTYATALHDEVVRRLSLTVDADRREYLQQLFQEILETREARENAETLLSKRARNPPRSISPKSTHNTVEHVAVSALSRSGSSSVVGGVGGFNTSPRSHASSSKDSSAHSPPTTGNTATSVTPSASVTRKPFPAARSLSNPASKPSTRSLLRAAAMPVERTQQQHEQEQQQKSTSSHDDKEREKKAARLLAEKERRQIVAEEMKTREQRWEQLHNRANASSLDAQPKVQHSFTFDGWKMR